MNVFLSEFKRMFIEKKLIYILIFLMFTFFIIAILNFIPVKMYGNNYTNGLNVWGFFLKSRIMTTFIVLFPVLIYCGSFGDDVETNFISNIIIRTGFKKYFTNKYLVTVLSGGILYFATSIVTFYLSWMIFGINPLDKSLKNALKIKLFDNYLFDLNSTNHNFIIYSIIISCILFILGIIYSSVGFLISLYTNNKMLIFGVSILSLRLYEQTVYTYAPLLGPFLNINRDEFYFRFSIFDALGYYSVMNSIVNSLILFSIIIFLIILKYHKLKKIYNEG